MMLHNKENAVLHAPHTGKANPKTPGPGMMSTKTPFNIPLNDENGAHSMHPKTGKKNLFAGLDPSAFVTPVGPRRQALAGKTTNVKARNLGPSAQQDKNGGKLEIKPQRSQLVISAQAEPALRNDNNNEVPEIEYMAPVPAELPYVPDDFEAPDYALLKRSYMKNMHRAFLDGIDENGKSDLQRTMERHVRMLEDDLDAETEEVLDQVKGIRKPRAVPKTVAPARSGSIAVQKTRRLEDKTNTTRKPTNASDAKRTTSTSASRRPTSRPPSSAATASYARPTSASTNLVRPTTSSSIRRVESSSSQRRAETERRAKTPDSRKTAELVSQRASRPTSSASITRPDSRINRHARSGSSTVVPAKKPTGTSRSRTRSTTSKDTIGYHAGKELGPVVKREVCRARMESTLDALERIQREDEAAEKELAVPPLDLLMDQDDVIVDFPSPLFEDEVEFFMTMPF